MLTFSACHNPDKVPKDVLAQKKMEAVLIDIHILEGGLLVMPNAVSYKEAYAAIFKKHNITAEQYEKSIKFYQEHPHMLFNIYQAVCDSLENRINQ
ncbi:MAG: DUF4296 domain-containing protein [Bacteroidia bacterium]|nr:DUF4296 domain-containing protein [Bacteroidia bacterium]